ncbi:MAG: PD-(D/E)XK nuclease family protein [Patescibacteria group bacterium]
MSEYYNPLRTKNVFTGKNSKGFRISRSKIELFQSCPLCFYLDRKLGVARPPGFPFALNSAVDTLLKKEFNVHRKGKTAHPLMTAYGLKNVIPFDHPEMDTWRENFVGVQAHHPASDFLITGAVDDIWVNEEGELIVVDYKSTSKEEKVTLDKEWQISYKRQMEVYQWLLRQNGFKVSKTGYFVYCNGKTDRKAFDGKLEFDIDVIPYTGDDSWIEPTLLEMKACLMSDTVPKPPESCDYCLYRRAARDVQGKKTTKKLIE